MDTAEAAAAPAPVADGIEPAGRYRLLGALGPGLITGASDDDPSGIGTYSQVGAQLGFTISWTMLLAYPLMVAIQEISARVGRTTGRGIAGVVCRHYPNWVLQSVVVLLFAANAINIGADLGAMADALKLLIGGSQRLYVVLFGAVCVLAQVFVSYVRYVRVLKWITLSLFAYVAALFAIHVPWGQALKGMVLPDITWTSDYFTSLLAIAGTTISPYLFFWQASQEAEDVREKPDREPLTHEPEQAPEAVARIRLDTLIGMAFSNIIAIAIIITTAATLHAQGVTNIQSSSQAAEALKPIAGNFAYLLFTLGIVGTGLLGVPVLAGSAAYAVGEGRRWPVGLARKPKEAIAFYCVLGIATMIGVGLNFTPIDPIQALYWSAVINGALAGPVMLLLMLITRRSKIMGDETVHGWVSWLGWAGTAAMGACFIGTVVTWVV